jgi:hypothetical protein
MPSNVVSEPSRCILLPVAVVQNPPCPEFAEVYWVYSGANAD